ncbi:MAG TPA: FliG C-terminal domain-containing protein [Polyangiaceae bacterium]|nr:FliG C-terminal domain-containing protein [Polyangiaceae bacterium]
MALNGPEKAVLLLLSLEESVATPIIADLAPAELRRLREVAANMSSVPTDALSNVYAEFVSRTQRAVAVPRGGVRHLHNIAVRALGSVKAQEMFAEAPQTAMQRLATADPTQLAGLLESEHPQLTAALLSQLDPAKAAKTLDALPEHVRPLVLARLGSMTEVPSELLEEAAMALGAELPAAKAESSLNVDGLAYSAQLVRKLGRQKGAALLEKLETENGELARQIRGSLYSFEDLLAVDAKGMRLLLESVPVERLTLALKTASETMVQHVFSSMSKRAAERIKEDMEAIGTARLSDVEAAQREILEVALRLDAEGQISLETGQDGG